MSRESHFRCHASRVFKSDPIKIVELEYWKKHINCPCAILSLSYGVYNTWIPAVVVYKSDIVFNMLENVDL